MLSGHLRDSQGFSIIFSDFVAASWRPGSSGMVGTLAVQLALSRSQTTIPRSWLVSFCTTGRDSWDQGLSYAKFPNNPHLLDDRDYSQPH
jgi:hypothetical protein